VGVTLIKDLITYHYKYPYPFLDVNTLGYGRVLLNIMGLGVFYLISGWILIAINNLLAEKETAV
jgi:hypothetical protein